mgnify:CR=1 FL=1
MVAEVLFDTPLHLRQFVRAEPSIDIVSYSQPSTPSSFVLYSGNLPWDNRECAGVFICFPKMTDYLMAEANVKDMLTKVPEEKVRIYLHDANESVSIFIQNSALELGIDLYVADVLPPDWPFANTWSTNISHMTRPTVTKILTKWHILAAMPKPNKKYFNLLNSRELTAEEVTVGLANGCAKTVDKLFKSQFFYPSVEEEFFLDEDLQKELDRIQEVWKYD